MKFLLKELYAGMVRAEQLRKRKRGSSHGVVTAETGTKVVEEKIGASTPISPIIGILAMTSFIGRASISSGVEMEVNG